MAAHGLTRPRKPSIKTLALPVSHLDVDRYARLAFRNHEIHTVADLAELGLADVIRAKENFDAFPIRALPSTLAALAHLGVALADGTFLRMPVDITPSDLDSIWPQPD